jgi:mono/diheme cytochrome c family protein
MAAAIEAGRWRTAVGALVASAALTLAAPVRAEGDFARGKALYENHCGTCHTCEAHTRKEPVVRNLAQLAGEVDRWQAQLKLNWKAQDKAAVVEYLSRTYYKF